MQPNGPYQENKLLMQSYFWRIFGETRKLSLFCIIIFLGMYEQRTAGSAGTRGRFHSTEAKGELPFFISMWRQFIYKTEAHLPPYGRHCSKLGLLVTES